METFSLSLFLESGWGSFLASIAMLGAVVFGIVSAIYVMNKLERAPALVRNVGTGLGLFGVPLCLIALLPRGQGEVTALKLVDVDGQRVIFGHFTWIARSGRGAGIRHSAERRFRVEDGERLGSLHTSGGLLGGGCRDAWADGRIHVCRESLEVLDAVTLEEIFNLGAALDERLGRDGYRVERIDTGAVVVERRDGRRETIELSTFGIPAAPRERLNLLGGCTATARRKDSGVEGLLRATPCPVADGELVLHRESAFGDGAHLVSLFDVHGEARWTTSLEPWMPGDSDDLRLLAPATRGGELAFWLLRDRVSLVEVVIDTDHGTPIRSDVVF